MLATTDIFTIIFIAVFIGVYFTQKRRIYAINAKRKSDIRKELATVLHHPKHKVKSNYE